MTTSWGGAGRGVFGILVLALSLPGSGVGQTSGPGGRLLPPAPLSFEEGSPVQRLGYTPMVEGADPVPGGRLQTDLWFGYSNIWENDSTATHHLYLDVERLVTALTVRYGATSRLEVGGRVTLETTWGGFMDGFLEGLHGVLDLSSRNRELYPRDEYRQFLELDGERVFQAERRRLSLEDVRVFGKWALHADADRNRVLSLRAVARVPTRQNAVGRERADLGLMLLGRTRWGPLHLHGMFGGSSVRRAPELRDVLNPVQIFLMAGSEYPVSSRFSLLAQFAASTQLLRDRGNRDIDLPPMNTILGMAWRTDGGWRIQAAIQEDTPPWGPSVDFTVQLGVSRAW